VPLSQSNQDSPLGRKTAPEEEPRAERRNRIEKREIEDKKVKMDIFVKYVIEGISGRVRWFTTVG
jgi:hypothetical protein